MLDELISASVLNTSSFKLAVSSIAAMLGGFLVRFFGGFDTLMITLVTMIVIDYITGVIRAIYQKKLSSSIGYRGILKKTLCLMVVGLSVTLQNIMPEAVPLREITIIFFVANEGFSVLENAAGLIPLPSKLREVLLQLREESEDNKASTSENTEEETPDK